MIGAIVFGLAVAAVGGFSVSMVMLTKFAARRRREESFPVDMGANIRATHGPFSFSEVKNQLFDLENLWPSHQPFDLSGLNIRWVEEPIETTEPFYERHTSTATVPFKNAERVWQTGLAHEAAHHALRDEIGHPTRVEVDARFREDIFSEESGAVRLAREASGMHTYPRKEKT